MRERDGDGRGVLAGVRVIEIAGIGPGPFAAMMLADHGAEVIRVERPGTPPDPTDVLLRSRTVVQHDLKHPDGRAEVIDLVEGADALIEGFRPGVMERLGLGPDLLIGRNPRLVYGRMTGWGQDGPLASTAGHDINYIALVGALHGYGRRGEKPTPPINMVGDFGGGGMMLAFGLVAGILNARATGRGQVIDCAMVDGASLLMGMIWGFRAKGIWSDERGTNYLDTGEPFYDSYATADGGHVAIGSIEPQFSSALVERLGLAADPSFADQWDAATRDERRTKLTEIFRSRGRDEWVERFADVDACLAPVLTMAEAPAHPHNAARGAFIDLFGVVQPAPAPRFSRTPAPPPRAPGAPPTSGDGP